MNSLFVAVLFSIIASNPAGLKVLKTEIVSPPMKYEQCTETIVAIAKSEKYNPETMLVHCIAMQGKEV